MVFRVYQPGELRVLRSRCEQHKLCTPALRDMYGLARNKRRRSAADYHSSARGPSKERPLGLRADSDFLKQDGCLMKYVLWASTAA